jgi:aspartate aminotransferase
MLFDRESERLLAPQERFDRLREVWLPRAGRQVCDLAYANAYEGPDVTVLKALRDAIDAQTGISLQYTPYGGSTMTRRMVAERLVETTGLAFDWRDVVLTPGAMAGLNVLFRALHASRTTPDQDEVIVVTPCWLDYPLYLVQHGMKPVLVPLRESDFHLNLDRIASALNPRTRALILSNPANPTGILYRADEIDSLATLLCSAQTPGAEPPVLISDECHRDVVLTRTAYVSMATHYDPTCIVYSFGKSLLIQGQRIGYVAVSPKAPDRRGLSRALERLCRVMGYCHPTSLMQTAIRDLISYVPDLSKLASRRRRTVESLESFGYRVVDAPATFFIYVQSPEPDEFKFVEKLAERGVFVLPASVFHHAGYVRLSITASEAMIDRALPVFRDLASHDIALQTRPAN